MMHGRKNIKLGRELFTKRRPKAGFVKTGRMAATIKDVKLIHL